MNIRRVIVGSFSLRLSLIIMVLAITIFSTAFVLNFFFARNYVKNEAMEHAQSALDNTALQIDLVLNNVETAVNNLAWLINENVDNPDYMYWITERLLKSNPFICGSAIAFEPNFYNSKGELYSPYSYREGDTIISKQLGTRDYEYHYMDWYQIPKLLNKPYWNEPYYDEGGANIIMTTYSLPIYNNNGELFAIFTADISLEWFAKRVNEIKTYPNSFNMMIGRGGTFLVHNDLNAILNETFFTSAINSNDTEIIETGNKMVSGEKGIGTFNRKGVDFYLLYAPVKATGWSVAVACMHSEIFSGVDGMRIMLSWTAIIGILIMVYLCYLTIKRLTTPLTKFAQSATEIAKGNFNSKLPIIRGHDEMRTLFNSFKYMQKSLVNYIDELQKTTANKERIESELRIAHEIQMGMIPKIFPPYPHRDDIDIFATLVPAKEVGGDLYDFFIQDDKFYFIIGDVSGKGVPASLVMAVTCRLFRTVASQTKSSSDIVATLNDALAEANESNMFCTFFLGILDLKTGEMEYCNAGHNAPIIIKPTGEVAFMQVESNIPLGIFESYPYQSQNCVIEPGTSLFLYTDGVTEAESINKELYSENRLIKALENNHDKSVQCVVSNILESIKQHSFGADQSDDITILQFQYNKI